MRVLTLLLAATLYPVTAGSAAPPPELKYYLNGIESPFGVAASVTALFKACAVKFGNECGNPSSVGVVDEAADLLPKISVFDVQQVKYQPERFANSREVARTLESLKSSLLSELKTFDVQFLGRFSATADVCPYENQQSFVSTLTRLVMHDYWDLEGEQLRRATLDVDSVRREYATRLRQDFPGEACVKARTAGQLLSEVYRIRLKDNASRRSDEPRRSESDRKFVSSYAFLWDLVVKVEADVGNQAFVDYLSKLSSK